MGRVPESRRTLIAEIVRRFGCTPSEAEDVIDLHVPWEVLHSGIPAADVIRFARRGITTATGIRRAIEAEQQADRERRERAHHRRAVEAEKERARQAAKDEANRRLAARAKRDARIQDLADRIRTVVPDATDRAVTEAAAVGIDKRAPVMRWLRAGVAPDDIVALWHAGVRDVTAAVSQSRTRARQRAVEADRRARSDAIERSERALRDRARALLSRPEPTCPACDLVESACRC